MDKTFIQDLRELKYTLTASRDLISEHRLSAILLIDHSHSYPHVGSRLVRGKLDSSWTEKVEFFFRVVFPKVLIIAAGLSNRFISCVLLLYVQCVMRDVQQGVAGHL